MAKKKVKSKPKAATKLPGTESNPVSSETTNSEAISTGSASYNAVTQSVFLKLCRLCESKDGPFLNIFDADKIIAKKIEELMPFGITENDDLPHKICFRCSAKVEELHEFIQKCIKTQESLRKAVGNFGQPGFKTKTRTAWEEKLIKTNMSNDDICDALIKKAMEGIKDMPLKPLPSEEGNEVPVKKNTRNSMESPVPKKELKNKGKSKDGADTTLINIDQEDIPPVRKTRSNKQEADSKNTLKFTNEQKKTDEPQKQKSSISVNSFSIDTIEPVAKKKTTHPVSEEKHLIAPEKQSLLKEIVTPSKEQENGIPRPEKPFNIMDHVSMIKVTGVGILFQCKLCNRNFVKKEVVESHNCARNGAPKMDLPKKALTPAETSKAPTVKYIKMDTSMKTALVERNAKPQEQKVEPAVEGNNSKIVEELQSAPVPRPKPRIGPASKVKKVIDESISEGGRREPNQDSRSTSQAPSLLFTDLPHLNGRYKLVPGPNNSFTLLEDKSIQQHHVQPPSQKPTQQPRQQEIVRSVVSEGTKTGKKRKGSDVTPVKSLNQLQDTLKAPEVVSKESNSQPYPVGLFQTVAHHSRMYEPPAAEPTAFMTPAMKKQSYTVVQTGNPSKLLISTKPQPSQEDQPLKKRQKKVKAAAANPEAGKEPFRVTLEDAAPSEDTGFFTFINVDPLLQPSYVLPTDGIIQESQISTSTPATSKVVESKEQGKYSCNMCGDTFSREKKLLAHIQSHYTQMDEEDLLRAEKSLNSKRKTQ